MTVRCATIFYSRDTNKFKMDAPYCAFDQITERFEDVERDALLAFRSALNN